LISTRLLFNKRTTKLLPKAFGYFCLAWYSHVAFSFDYQVDNQTLVKAGYILTFPKFINWPEQYCKNQSQVISVYDDHILVKYLQSIAGKNENYNIKVKSISSVDDIGACEIVYISPQKSDESTIYALNHIVKDKNGLTIGDKDGLALQGIMINFFRQNQVIKFEINQQALNSANLKPSYKLMKVARVVN